MKIDFWDEDWQELRTTYEKIRKSGTIALYYKT